MSFVTYTTKLAAAFSLLLFSTSDAALPRVYAKKRATVKRKPVSPPVPEKPVELPPVEEPVQMQGSIPRPYLDWRLPVGDKRSSTFEQVFALLEAREAKTLVETGTSRGGVENFIGDGGSTIIFGNWALDHGAHLTSVDLDPIAVESAAQGSLPYAEAITFVCSDSISFLETFDNTIDFLYLDSFDYEQDNPLPSQEHHLREIIAAEPFLTANSVIMIDDCDLPGEGKGKLVIEYLLERGWKIFAKGYQVILIRDDGDVSP